MSSDSPTKELEDTAESATDDVLTLFRTDNYSLNHRILPRCCLYSKLEPGENETIAIVSTANKIIIKQNESALNILDKIKCISTAPFGKAYDVIIIGTESQVIAYDFYQNATLFQREVPDGINCMTFGKLGEFPPMLICGGNCAIWGFDATGADKYWTVTGDSVTCLSLCDYDLDGELELVTGSPDHEIRIFKNDLMRCGLTEADAVVSVCTVQPGRFVFALANGTLGLYEKDTRLWRIKSKTIVSFIIDFPRNEEFFTCIWDNGKADIRSVSTGEIHFFKTPEKNAQPSGALRIRKEVEEEEELCILYEDGKVVHYGIGKKDVKMDKTEETLRDYGQMKHNLLVELNNFETEEQLTDAERDREDYIPANTIVSSELHPNVDNRMLYLNVTSSNSICIRGVVAFGEGMFNGDSCIWIPPKIEGDGDSLLLPLVPAKDIDCDLNVRVFLGREDSHKLFLFDQEQIIPKFARFANVPDNHPNFEMPQSYVEFEMKVRNQRVVDWMHNSFLFIEKDLKNEPEDIDLKFVGLAPKSEHNLVIQYSFNAGKMKIMVNCMETCGSIVQSLAQHLAINTLISEASFTAEFRKVKDIVDELDDLYEVRQRLKTELTEKQSQLKEIIVRAEDALAMQDMELARKLYTRLRLMDDAARQSYILQTNTHSKFKQSFRTLNKSIESAAKLRVGEPNRALIQACREAILEDNKEIIPKLLEHGANIQ